ncbi:MAG: hypothetical protein M3137_08015 [Actinomycetota bacterium]|nr:hypothetical protein [Actinomycetota bacterium]
MITARPATRTRTAPRPGRPRQPSRSGEERGGEDNVRYRTGPPTRDGGDRRHRRLQRRRIVREEIIVLSVLVMALIITVVVLAHQWLQSSPTVASSIIMAVLPNASGGLA